MATVVVDEKMGATHPTDDGVAPQTWSFDEQNRPNEKTLTRTSEISTPSTVHQTNPFDNDIEAMVSSGEPMIRKSTQCIRGGADCQVWPGQDHWKRKAKAAKRERRACNCLAHLSRRNRIIVKILIGLLIVGIAVGVGFGVSKPLGAGIWHDNK
ncbi:hypothetical protein QBC33DRAFT_560163 [Phialemonium atrogriseum]|uniref:Uncharacterized protein n=1 Tax=Phialemonium atrogriseum TaxID=1093897 RepID=A0AAJ0FKC1_9PEZI|nr:uncharacterized protein QBC33DRAFT_560163 [Phialemonium atrogriseum]KAK1766258.1 hypothetical protein QBC33DRAFT_560163 [Phialemonium atrogriseum]